VKLTVLQRKTLIDIAAGPLPYGKTSNSARVKLFRLGLAEYDKESDGCKITSAGLEYLQIKLPCS
jgi:hypothetical protein